MAFRVTPNVKISKDAHGVVRRIDHARQPYTAATTLMAASATTPSRRALADQYLREVLPEFQMNDDAVSDLNAALASAVVAGEGAKLRFQKEKVVGQQATVSYMQTCEGLEVWESGITVRMRGEDRITGSSSSVQHDVRVDLPAEDAPFRADRINADVLKQLLGIDADDAKVTINGTPLLVYHYDAGNRGACEADSDDESHLHVAHPCLSAPEVPDSIRNGRHYVVVNALFTLSIGDGQDHNWSAFIEPDTGAVLFLRCFVGCIDGFVIPVDPLTSSGNTVIRPDSSTAVLNGLRERVALEGLDTAAPGENAQLRGEFVQLTNIEFPTAIPPTVDPGSHFLFNVPTDDFGAVNAYFNCDRLFRILETMGFNARQYFDGTTFPVRVDHRVAFGTTTGNEANASAPGNVFGNGSDGFRFALAQRDTNVCMSVDWRVVLHEFGHSILWDNVNSPNFRFAHSAGDSLAAILNDAESSAPDRGRTFPWSIIARRHDRPVSAGWAWGGNKDSIFPVGDRRSRDVAGYDREQILSSTLFRLYQAIGGAHADVAIRQSAARYVTFLVFDSVAALTRFAQPDNAEDFADQLMESDISTTSFEGQPGGGVHKVVRWSFEQQGAYQPPGAPNPVRSAGAPPAVDVFIDDGRGGEYLPGARLIADTTDIWSRLTNDSGTAHQPPEQGETNFVYVRVGNRGASVAQNCTVRLFETDNEVAPVWPTDWTEVGTATVSRVDGNDDEIAGPIEWTPSAAGAQALMASVSHADDPSNLDLISGTISTARLAHCDNNVAVRPVTVVAGAVDDDDQDDMTVSTKANLDIPDANDVGVSSELDFGQSGAIKDLEVALDIKHPFIGDLKLTLIAPSGTEVILHNKTGSGDDDIITTMTSVTNSGLAALRGESARGTWKLHAADLVGDDRGTIREWGLTFQLDTSPRTVERRSNPGLAIPDADDQGISDRIAVSQTGELRSVAVPVTVRHTFIGDLAIKLTSPSGKSVTLHNQQGGNSRDVETIYTRETLPQLEDLAGESIEGEWTLKVTDAASADTGTLESWGLLMTVGPAVPRTVRGESTPSLAIPDENPAGVSDTLTISDGGSIQTARAQIEIRHTFVGDLKVALISPSGTEVMLHNLSGGRQIDLIQSYSAEDFAPMRALGGESGEGEWTLNVSDHVGQDEGLLVRWNLELTYNV